MINSRTNITQYPDGVEYRNQSTIGIEVILIHWQLFTPRISSSVELVRDGELIRFPLPLPVDDVLEFCLDAAQRLGRNPNALRRAYEALNIVPSAH